MTESQMKAYLKKEIKSFVDLVLLIVKEEKWTYTQISEAGHLSTQTISKLLNRDTKSPHFATLVKIGCAINLKINWSHIVAVAAKRTSKRIIKFKIKKKRAA